MEKFLQMWHYLNIHQRSQFLANAMTSLFITGLVIPTIFGILGVVFDSYRITALGSAVGLSFELIAIYLCIWRKWILNLI